MFHSRGRLLLGRHTGTLDQAAAHSRFQNMSEPLVAEKAGPSEHTTMTASLLLATSAHAPRRRAIGPIVGGALTEGREPASTKRSRRRRHHDCRSRRKPAASIESAGGDRREGLICFRHEHLAGPPALSARRAVPGFVSQAHPPPHAASPTRGRLPKGRRPSQMPCTDSFRTNGGYTDAGIDRLADRLRSLSFPRLASIAA
jgi:hypothetical protein